MKQIEAKDKKQIIKDAEKVIKRIKDSGLKQDHIATAIDAKSESLSRFMNLKEGFVTQSMVNRLNVFLDSKK